MGSVGVYIFFTNLFILMVFFDIIILSTYFRIKTVKKGRRIMRLFTRVLICVVVFTGCAGVPAYKQVFNERPAYNFKDYNYPHELVYDAVIRAVLVRQFIIEEENKESGFILAKRYFQKGKKSTMLLAQAKITSFGKNNATLYLNFLETTERLFVTDRTRFFLFIIPLPGGGGQSTSTVKEGEKMINDESFFNDFFAAVDKEVALLASQIPAVAVTEDVVLPESPIPVAAEPETEVENEVNTGKVPAIEQDPPLLESDDTPAQ
jgi:hypothetical protein